MISHIILIVILLLLSSFFSSTETAYTSVNKVRLKNISKDYRDIRYKSAKLALKLEDEYDKLLTTILVGNNLVNIALATLMALIFTNISERYGATISTIITTVGVLIFGEISPKTMAKQNADSYAIRVAGILNLFILIFTPVTKLFSAWTKFLEKKVKRSDNKITSEDLKVFVDEASGDIDKEHSELIKNSIAFEKLTASNVMTPRVEVIGIEVSDNALDIAERFRKSGYSRMPVYEDDLDKVVGIVNHKDFADLYMPGGSGIEEDFLKKIITPPLQVTEALKLSDVMHRMQNAKSHIAVVVDEYGGTEGIITLEDIVEQLVGEIFDEHDSLVSEGIIALKNGSFNVKADTNLKFVLSYFKIPDSFIEEYHSSTVNGWVNECLDHLPRLGDEFEKIYGNKKIKVRVFRATARKSLEVNFVVEKVKSSEE